MASKLDIPLYEASLSIVRRCGADLCEIINTKFGCVAAIEGVENESRSSHQRPPAIIKPERRFEFMMHSGVKVSVWKADLTNFPADAVVNAANEDLKHYGGLALALSKAGGPQIQLESDDYIKKYSKVNTGEAVVLSSGSLPCKMIIHAVGPDLSMSAFNFDPEKGRPALEKTIKSILNRVGENHLATVAIPAISSGLFNYPLRECANTIVSTIRAFCDKLPHQNHYPKEIFLANHDEPTVQEMERACNQIFKPQQKQTYSSAAAQNTRSAENATQPSVTIGNVHLILRKGKIEEQRTDVIVNTASGDRNLSIGKISGAILDKAGYGIQNEIKQAQKKGYIIRTKSYRLYCKEVFHTFCIEKARDPAADQILYSSVLDCLSIAAAQHYNSITFPAIGTGALGFSKAESASIMLAAVSAFAQNCLNRMDIHFVIFPSDHGTFQAFEWEIGRLQKRSASFNFPPEITGADGKSRHRSPQQHPLPYSGDQHRTEASWNKDESQSSRAPAPQISLVCPSEESKHEAERWLKNRLSTDSHSVTINNNFLSHFSDHDHLQLAVSAEKGLIVEEFFSKGHACLEINGGSKEEVAVAGLKVEAMLCKIQKEFIREEEHGLQMLFNTELSHKRKPVEKSSREFSSRHEAFSHALKVTKVDKVENAALKAMFDMKKKQLGSSSSKTMFQRIPAQFCEMVSRIGFHAECAPPEDPKYGEGIYFSSSIGTALELWREKGEEYLYFVEAEVLLGNSAKGERGFILPPPVGKDPNILCDSVYGGSDVSIIFSGYQALPKYIITCKKNSR